MSAMKKHDRVAYLLELVEAGSFLRLRDAATQLGVSEMTVRRYVVQSGTPLAVLGGYIVREGETAAAYALDREQVSHRRAKEEACDRALALLQPEDTIFIDCGTTMPYLASRLPTGLSLTVVCYALNIAHILARRDDIRLIVAGGVYHGSSASFAGDSSLAILKRVRLNKAFISAGGVHPTLGVSCWNFHEVPAKRAAIEAAVASYLVVDSSKLGRVRPAHFAECNEFEAVLSETGVIVPADLAGQIEMLEAGERHP
jgi:DeoR family deoxyribose operon repressor